MASKKSNLYFTDRSFIQDWTLKFKESATELKFLTETNRFQLQSLNSAYIWSLILILYLYFISEIKLLTLSIVVLAFLALLFPKGNLTKRMILLVFCLSWEKNSSSQGNFSECLGLFFPSFVLNFFILKSWLKSSIFYTIEIFFLSLQTNLPFQHLCVSALTYTFFIFLFEKDFRNLWLFYASNKKSNGLHKSLWSTFPGAQLLMNNEGKIILYNKASIDMIKFQKKSIKILKSGNFSDFFEKFEIQSERLLKKVFKGENSEEIYMNKEENFVVLNHENIGQLLMGDSVSWVSGTSARVTSFDVSCHIAKKYLVFNSSLETEKTLQHLSWSLAQTFKNQRTVSAETLCVLNKIQQDFKGATAIQSNFVGSIRLSIESFNVHCEIHNAIELLYPFICAHNVSLVYTREKGIPNTLLGEKSLHSLLIFSLLEFAIQNSEERTEILVLVQISVINKQTAVHSDISLSYKITFTSKKIRNNEVEDLFTIRKKSHQQRDMDHLLESMTRNGAAFTSIDTVLIALKGFFVPAGTEPECNKVIINICVPFRTSEKNLESKFVKISNNTINITPLTTKWIPEKDFGKMDDLTEELQNEGLQYEKCIRSIESCDTFEIKPYYEKIDFNENSVFSELNDIEENNVQLRMKNYHVFRSECFRDKTSLDNQFFEVKRKEKKFNTDFSRAS